MYFPPRYIVTTWQFASGEVVPHCFSIRAIASARFVAATVGVLPAGTARGDFRRDVGDLLQLVGRHPLADALVFPPRRVEAVAQQVLTGLRGGLHAGAGAVVVRHDEAVGRHERRRAAGNAEGAEPDVIEPLRRGLEPVALAPVVERRLVEGPHLPGLEPRILGLGLCRRRGQRAGQQQREGGQDRQVASEHERLHGELRGRKTTLRPKREKIWLPRAQSMRRDTRHREGGAQSASSRSSPRTGRQGRSSYAASPSRVKGSLSRTRAARRPGPRPAGGGGAPRRSAARTARRPAGGPPPPAREGRPGAAPGAGGSRPAAGDTG